MQVIHYEYDGVQRLIEARVEDGTTYSYGYDEVGNRTRSGETTTAYDAANQVIGWQYDAAGNLLSDGTTSYTYDALNRLRGVVSSGGTTSYTYNGDGVLLAQVQGGAETRFVADVARGLPERVGAVTGTAATWYVRGLGGEELYFGGALASPPTLHPYGYAAGNPLLYTDPTGECLGWLWNSPSWLCWLRPTPLELGRRDGHLAGRAGCGGAGALPG